MLLTCSVVIILLILILTGLVMCFKVQDIYYWYKKVTFKDEIPCKWKDEKVKYLIRYRHDEKDSPDFIVYIDFQDDINWSHDGNTSNNSPSELPTTQITEGIEKTLTEVALLEMKVQNWDTSIKYQVKRLLGEIIVQAFSNRETEELIKEAKQFIAVKHIEISRAWILRYSFMATLLSTGLVFFAFLALDHKFVILNHVDWLTLCLLATGMGGIGAFYSILARAGNMHYNGMLEKMLHKYEAWARIATGAISGLFSPFIVKMEVLLPTIFTESNVASVLALAFIAGVSERLVPSIISMVERSEPSQTTPL